MVDWSLNNTVEHVKGDEFKVVENDEDIAKIENKKEKGLEQDFPHHKISAGDTFKIVGFQEEGDGVSYSVIVELESGETVGVLSDKGFLMMLDGRGIIEADI